MLNVKDVVLIYQHGNVEMLDHDDYRWPTIEVKVTVTFWPQTICRVAFGFSPGVWIFNQQTRGPPLKRLLGAVGSRNPISHESGCARSDSGPRGWVFIFVVKYQHKCLKLKESLLQTENIVILDLTSHVFFFIFKG